MQKFHIPRRTFKELIGQLSALYIDGRSCRKSYCIDCSKLLSRSTTFKGQQRCQKCTLMKSAPLRMASRRSYEGKNNPMYGRITHGKWSIYKNIWIRSSWEIKFAYFLDCSGIKWDYESKTFDLGNTTYTPDFYLPEFDCYIEVKCYCKKEI